MYNLIEFKVYHTEYEGSERVTIDLKTQFLFLFQKKESLNGQHTKYEPKTVLILCFTSA